jgi:hypothetical protein
MRTAVVAPPRMTNKSISVTAMRKSESLSEFPCVMCTLIMTDSS